ncbi:BTAD domain-containing putative transcriptional regulator [Streptomyces polygonati]|uniref:BTAD domain-containing putative transcriptional regulator n=1 Tax=Streptomyces polygonati TaxID=1617087 RepID=A0ABV8HJR8_9ACTN
MNGRTVANDEFRFGVLGPVQVRWTGRPVELGARQQALLAVLLLHMNTPVPAAAIVDAVWGEQPPAHPRNALQTTVSRLRQALRSGLGAPEGMLVAAGAGYVLHGDPAGLDAALFARHLHLAGEYRRLGDPDAAVARVDAALALWRGEPFEGLTGAAFEAEQQRLRELRLDALSLRARLSLDQGLPGEAVARLTPLVAAHPLRESLRLLLMLALCRAGRRADALAAYEEARRTLADELGIDPGPELREAHRRILRDEPELTAAAPAAPPPIPPGPGAADDPTAGSTDRRRLDRAARELAAVVLQQWTVEARTRSLHRPAPIRVRWSSTGRPVAAGASAVLGADSRAAGQTQRLDLRGDLAGAVAAFRRLPARQLVVLGEPGAGKTVLAILLTLGLLGDPEPGEPTPVLVPLSSWDPHREHLHTWLARKLVEEYPGLDNAAAYGPDAAVRLVTEGRVLPVLDGLDEMPPALHAPAIDALDQALSGGRPLVVTCRGAEYETAVHVGGAILARAAVVEIDPVGVEEAADFLTARQPPGATRWQPVVERLRRHPDGPLARALSTALMVDLARTAYAAPSADPAELTDAVRFPDRAAIENHLLDAFLPAVYARRPAPPDPDRRAAPSPDYSPDQARRWLTFLARQLHNAHTSDLAWWQLDRAMPPATRGFALGLPAAVMFAVTGMLAEGPLVGLVYGSSYGLAGYVANGWGRRPGPARVEVRFRGTARRFSTRFAIGLVAAGGLGLGWSIPADLFGWLLAVFGLGLGAHVWLDVPTDVRRISSPPAVLSQERLAALAFTLSFAVSLGLAYTMAFTYSTEKAYHHLGFDLRLALSAALASSLLGRFLFRRVGAVAYGLAGIALGGTAISRAPDLAHGLLAGAAFAVAVGASVAVSRPWGAFTMSRVWLALRGRTPLRLMLFLEDAHRRGVLRRTGAVYQFRHARLQRRLAAAGPSTTADLPPPVPESPHPRAANPRGPGRSAAAQP